MSDNTNNKTSSSEKSKPAPSRLLMRIAFTALFAALTAAGAFIAFPVGPVPIVLQNLFALLSGLVLGPVLGGAAVGLFLLAGLLNFPVFSGGGGIVRFAGPTGGYLIGYLLAALTAGLIAGRPRADASKKILQPRIIAAVIAGFLIIYVPGLIWLKSRLKLDWIKALMTGFIPFVIGDALKGIAAVLIAPRLRRIAADFLDEKS
jgi:biotin transport system substrate-specific component